MSNEQSPKKFSRLKHKIFVNEVDENELNDILQGADEFIRRPEKTTEEIKNHEHTKYSENNRYQTLINEIFELAHSKFSEIQDTEHGDRLIKYLENYMETTNTQKERPTEFLTSSQQKHILNSEEYRYPQKKTRKGGQRYGFSSLHQNTYKRLGRTKIRKASQFFTSSSSAPTPYPTLSTMSLTADSTIIEEPPKKYQRTGYGDGQAVPTWDGIDNHDKNNNNRIRSCISPR